MTTRSTKAKGRDAGSDGNPGDVSKQGGIPVRETSNSELKMEDGTIFKPGDIQGMFDFIQGIRYSNLVARRCREVMKGVDSGHVCTECTNSGYGRVHYIHVINLTRKVTNTQNSRFQLWWLVLCQNKIGYYKELAKR